MSSFTARNLTEIEAVAGCTFACISNTVFRMFSCLRINCQPFYLRQLLKFHPFDWMIEIYLQTEGQGTHHKMVTLQPMPGFSPLLYTPSFTGVKNRSKPFVSPDHIALADREGKENWRAASFTILASCLYSFDFVKLETRLTTQPASQPAS